MADQSHWDTFERRQANWCWKKSLVSRIRHLWQRLSRGYDDTEVWNLDDALTALIQPRLKCYVTWQTEHGSATPDEFAKDPAAWLEVLRKMERAFDLLVDSRSSLTDTPEAQQEIEEGLALFGRYYRGLWG